jgi:colanic acid biosynthesis glycosyl transferase WcaI
MKSRVEREGVVGPQNIVIVPLWPVTPDEGDEVAAAQSVNPFRDKYGLVGKFVVVHSGNLSYVHPLDTVLDAMVRLKDDPLIIFVFIGYGVREKDINEHVRRHGLANVLKLPYQPRELLGKSLGMADLHLIVMGNTASGLLHSSKIYAVLASGQPYLFVGPRDSHIVSDVLEPCGGGFHVENGDVDGFVETIEKVRRLSVEERRAIQLRNRAFVASHFRRDECLARFTKRVIGPSSGS